MADNHQRNSRNHRARHLSPYRWQPGQSGNPKGRPKGRTLTSILKEVLSGNVLCAEVAPLGLTVGEALIEAMVRHAMNGDSSLAREIILRSDGKAPDVPADTLPPMSDEEYERARYAESLSDEALIEVVRKIVKDWDEARARGSQPQPSHEASASGP